MSDILSISELTQAIRGQLEERFAYVWVQGQVTNVSRPASGHVYFSLRDEGASLACVWFKNRKPGGERFDPLTGEVFEDGPRESLSERLENGQEVICSGRLTVYPPRGGYQLIVEFGQETGTGRLHAEFEALKLRLAALGYFDAARKRPLPRLPRRVAVITSPAGAAIRDFLRIVNTCGPGSEIRIYPSPVQGEEAPGRLAAMLRQAGADQWAELIVLIRGGGSLEDLWAFNSPLVAEAIFESPVPVLAGIGHEVDFTIADMTADARAATPTHAGHLLWPERRDLAQQVDESSLALQRRFLDMVERYEHSLATARRALSWFSPDRTLERGLERLAEARRRLLQAGEAIFVRRDARLTETRQRLGAAFGLPSVRERLAALDALEQRLRFSSERRAENIGASLDRLRLALEALDPLRPLGRGYSLALDVQGRIVRSVKDASPGMPLRVRVADGALDATIDRITPLSE